MTFLTHYQIDVVQITDKKEEGEKVLNTEWW